MNFPLAVSIVAGGLLLGYEGYAWRTQRAPTISDLVKAAERKHPAMTRAAILGLGLLLGHFWH